MSNATGAETETPLLLTIALAGRVLGLSPYQTKKLLDRGALPCERIGERIYIPAKAVHEYVDSITTGDEVSA